MCKSNPESITISVILPEAYKKIKSLYSNIKLRNIETININQIIFFLFHFGVIRVSDNKQGCLWFSNLSSFYSSKSKNFPRRPILNNAVFD